MIPEGNLRSNVERFTGYENLYDQYRPEAPQRVVDLITNYLGNKPSLVVDLGCGTGLSSFVWKGQADRIIGIEPNADMIGKAREKLAQTNDEGSISFIPGYSNRLELEAGTVDVITCSQSFHWMEPPSTLKEASRVLTDGGIFAAYDCDWPPTVHWTLDAAYNQLIEKADAIIAAHTKEENRAIKRNKDRHLKQLQDSGEFRFTKEIVFHNVETCDADRYAGLAFSQGGVQTVLKLGSKELDADIATFRSMAESYFQGQTLDVLFSYRMRLGVK
jgi:ubiquinone/menaquinone biosynthesis C-methylase UbiE